MANDEYIDVDPEPQGLVEAKEAVRAFLVKAVKKSTESTASSAQLTLLQIRNGGERVVTNRLTYRMGDPESQAEEVVQAAQEDLETLKLRGRVRYKLMAQVGPKQPFVAFMLYVPTNVDEVEDAFENNDNVDPSAMGREAMNQRHTEAFARIIAAQATRGERLLANLLDRANVKIETLENRIEEYRAREDEFQSREFAKKIVLEDRKIEQERRDRNMKLLLGVGGAIGAKMLGAPPEALISLLSAAEGGESAPTKNEGAPKKSAGEAAAGPTRAELDRFFVVGEALFDSLEKKQEKLLELANILSEDEQRAIYAMYGIVSEVRKRRIAQEAAETDAQAPRKTNGRRSNGVGYKPYDPYADGGKA